jgi:hypothetical protein
MVTNYEQLTAEERATIRVMAEEGQRLRAMARLLRRAPSTTSREWRRHAVTEEAADTRGYDAKRAGQAGATSSVPAASGAPTGGRGGPVRRGGTLSAGGWVAGSDRRHPADAVA